MTINLIPKIGLTYIYFIMFFLNIGISLAYKVWAKNQPHHTLLALDLMSLINIYWSFNHRIIYLFSFCEWRFNEHKMGHGIKSQIDKSVKEARLTKGWPEWDPQSWALYVVFVDLFEVLNVFELFNKSTKWIFFLFLYTNFFIN